MICTNCGKAVDEGAAFCQHCGTAMTFGGTDYTADIHMSDVDNYEETMAMMPPISEIPSTEFCLKCGKVLRSGQSCSCSDSYRDSREYDEAETEKTRIDDSGIVYTPQPLKPTYHVAPAYRDMPAEPRYEKPPVVHREEPPAPIVVPPARPASKPSSSDGRAFFKSVNKL